MRNYTPRELTYPSDRLPGIAGIAHIIQSKTGFHYVARRWKQWMVLDILWSTSWDWYNQIQEGLTGSAGAPRYLDSTVALEAPSWSWASTTAAINFAWSEDDWLDNQCATIREVDCKVEGNNLFGEVKQGSVQIKGLLRQMHFICTDPRDPSSYGVSNIRPQIPDHSSVHALSDNEAETAGFIP